MNDTANLKAPIPACFVCGAPLRVSLTRSRKGRVAVGLTCSTDGRHFRGFVNHRPFVEEVVARAGAVHPTEATPEPLQNPSKTPTAPRSVGRGAKV